MPAIDETLIFRPLSIGLLTISDSRNVSDDLSGDILAARLKEAGHRLHSRALVKDDRSAISNQVKAWANDNEINIILTTGGTGLTGRDVTIEALMPMFEKTLDGFSVVFQKVSFETIGLATLQSRACAGIIQGTIIFCLPGSTGAVSQAWDDIIQDALDSRYRPSSLVDILPRLIE